VILKGALNVAGKPSKTAEVPDEAEISPYGTEHIRRIGYDQLERACHAAPVSSPKSPLRKTQLPDFTGTLNAPLVKATPLTKCAALDNNEKKQPKIAYILMSILD
jgi:hypothetical protein